MSGEVLPLRKNDSYLKLNHVFRNYLGSAAVSSSVLVVAQGQVELVFHPGFGDPYHVTAWLFRVGAVAGMMSRLSARENFGKLVVCYAQSFMVVDVRFFRVHDREGLRQCLLQARVGVKVDGAQIGLESGMRVHPA